MAKPHVHTGAISATLQDAVTNETLCTVSRENGGLASGTSDRLGDEAGYLVGIRICTWSAETAPRYAIGHPLRAITVYDASEQQYGVMAQWLLATQAERIP